MESNDVLIIGSGPAGLTAAIYTSRAFLKTTVIGGRVSGGQLMITTEVENYPGFPRGIMGPELISNMREQATTFGTDFVDEDVVSISGNSASGFSIQTDESKTFIAKSIIIATGATANWLNLPNEQRLIGKGVSACATCDGFFFKNKVVVVVGGGDTAMEEATFLTNFASRVFILVRGEKEKLRASKIMQEKAFSNPKIEFLYNSSVVDVLGEEVLSGVIIKNTLTDEISTLECQGLFVAIGHSPATKFLNGIVELDDKGYLKVVDGTKTSKDGVFSAGDVQDYRYRQAVTAAGMGCMAALDAQKYLQGH
jgi:thioredoxin reductase (NADPH)